jgi:hypothetical protein
LRGAELHSICGAWCDDLVDLIGYASNFPDVVDPGNFLHTFCIERDFVFPEEVFASISAGFYGSFYRELGQSVEDYRRKLSLSSLQLESCLLSLRAEISKCDPQEKVRLAGLHNSQPAFEAASEVHRLLGLAPRGVWVS